MHALKGVEEEFAGLSLGDERLERRALAIVGKAALAPALSLPEMLPKSNELEGAYRFFQNASVSAKRLLKPHQQATFERIKGERVVRIVHDTVALSFGGRREGLGAMGSGGCGFYVQVALAVADGERRCPLGVVGIETKVYPTVEEKRKRHERAVRKFDREKLSRFPSAPVVWRGVEKWSTIPMRVRNRLKGIRAIHVMDQEADNFEVLQKLAKNKIRFVIRGSCSRRVRSSVDEGSLKVQDKLEGSQIILTRRVRLAARPKPRPGYLLRDERDATLSARATRLALAPTVGGHLTLNVVEVFEPTPPPGEEPINWVLFTNEPIDSPKQVAEVVDHYRARWRIEELFKVLKTGCSIERRQLTSFEALQRVMVLFIPVAWHLLAMRTLARQDNTLPATKVMTPFALTVLRALTGEIGRQMSESPSAYEALLTIAGIGGHLKNNGDPGWITLARGYEKLRAAQAVWLLATSQTPLER